MVEVRVLGDVRPLHVRNELAPPLRLAIGEVEVRRRVVGVRGIEDLVEVRQTLLPVARVRGVRDQVRRAGIDEERSRTDRVRVLIRHRVLGRVAGTPDVLGHDADLTRDVIEVGLRRRFEGHHDLVAIHRDVRQPTRPHRVRVERGILLEQVEREQHVGR